MPTIQEIKTRFSGQNITGLALDIDETLSWTLGHWVDVLLKKFGNPEDLSVRDLITKYRYTVELPLIEGADIFVKKIHEIVPIVTYITARPESVLGGTASWLSKHNFPVADIILRPIDVRPEDGNKWKAGVLEELYPFVEGIVDDNPGLPNELSAEYRGSVYLYDCDSYEPAKDNVFSCKTWQDVYAQIEKLNRPDGENI